MLAREGTLLGLMECSLPCRAMNATRVPEGSWAIVIGELGYPQGYFVYSFIRQVKKVKLGL